MQSEALLLYNFPHFKHIFIIFDTINFKDTQNHQ